MEEDIQVKVKKVPSEASKLAKKRYYEAHKKELYERVKLSGRKLENDKKYYDKHKDTINQK
jgi:hypothetical protein